MFQMAWDEFRRHFQNSRQEYGNPQIMSSSRQILKPGPIIEIGYYATQTWILIWKHNKCRNTNNNCDPKWTCLVSIERFQGQFLLSIRLPGFYTFLSLPQQSLNILTLCPHVSIFVNFNTITMPSSVLVLTKTNLFREGKCKENLLPAFLVHNPQCP